MLSTPSWMIEFAPRGHLLLVGASIARASRFCFLNNILYLLKYQITS
jgi:hypothetical protein